MTRTQFLKSLPFGLGVLLAPGMLATALAEPKPKAEIPLAPTNTDGLKIEHRIIDDREWVLTNEQMRRVQEQAYDVRMNGTPMGGEYYVWITRKDNRTGRKVVEYFGRTPTPHFPKHL